MLKAWRTETMHKRTFSFGSEASFGSLEKQEYCIEGVMLKDQGVVKKV